MDEEISLFVKFCVKSLAEKLEISSKEVYKLISEDTDILQSYIIPCFKPLHTQSKGYIVSDIIDVLKERGALE